MADEPKMKLVNKVLIFHTLYNKVSCSLMWYLLNLLNSTMTCTDYDLKQDNFHYCQYLLDLDTSKCVVFFHLDSI